MSTLSALCAAIQDILQDSSYTDEVLTPKINAAILGIAAGIRMPDKSISPPLPDLYTIGTIDTTINAYASLPVDYQRKVCAIVDSSGCRIDAPQGKNYEAFAIFMRDVQNLNLTEVGSVYMVAVKGKKLYYQGIPTTAQTLGIHYYRKPTVLVDDNDEPDCLPDHLQERLIKHKVLADIFGEGIEDGQDNKGSGTQYHTGQFFEAMTELCDFIGIDSEPVYYGDDNDAMGSM